MHRLLTLGLLTLATTSFAQDWGQLATISSTMGIQGGKLCLGEASRGDIGCPAYAPSVSPTGTLTTTAISLTTSGTNWGYLASTVSYLPNLNAGSISTTNISATTLNGIAISQLVGGTSSTMVPGWPDAIKCDSPSLGLNRVFYFQAFSQTGTTVQYALPYDSQATRAILNYNINGTYHSNIGATTEDCTTSAMSITQLYAAGRAFNFLSSGGIAPTGAIMAFDLATCPTGWSEYTPARGRFLRGIDNGAGNDPSGTRVAGNIQTDAIGPHTHSLPARYQASAWNNGGGVAATDAGGSAVSMNAGAFAGTETRPKNVAVLFCRKD